jgi:hypothetical protein
MMPYGRGLFLAAFAVALCANVVVAEAAPHQQARPAIARATAGSSGARIYLLENSTPTNTAAAESFQGRFNVDY